MVFGGRPAQAAERVNLSTLVEARLARQSWSAARKDVWRKALKDGLADAAEILVDGKDPSVGLFMGILLHAERSKIPPASAVAVARAAFRAGRKGAEPQALQRLASRALDRGRRVEGAKAWLLGLADMHQAKVESGVAEALVGEAIEKNWTQSEFSSLKWCLVRAVRRGHDAEDFLAFLLKTGGADKISPDRRCALATRHFVREQMAETVGKTRVAKPVAYKLALPLPGSLSGCQSFTRFYDMDGDGSKGKYKVVSLLECNGHNLVSLVKSQVEGTCVTYSTTAYLETLVGRKLLAARPATADHPLQDFLSVDLGESINNYCLKPIPILAGSSMTIPKKEKATYATFEAFLPTCPCTSSCGRFRTWLRRWTGRY